jgi:2-dehydro-3-deoxyphosphogluconate aldolase/(4S)-4-hydroxy-2-oxoglutarate aldolase
MRFIPTGGISPANLNEYLAFPKIIACGGSWMVPEKLVDEEKWDEITELAKEAVLTMLDVKIKHIGINSEDEAECEKTAALLSAISGKPMDNRSKSIFAGSEFEVMKFMGVGKCGHIGLSVTSVKRAVRFFESQGFEFDYDSLILNDKGEMSFIYFKNEIGGFGIHLVNA